MRGGISNQYSVFSIRWLVTMGIAGVGWMCICFGMPTYVYDTQPVDCAMPPRRFEMKQSMMDAPLTHDPETGLPVRRVIGANINFMAADNTGAGSAAGVGGGSCGTGCGCH